jgi:hypothetical protein
MIRGAEPKKNKLILSTLFPFIECCIFHDLVILKTSLASEGQTGTPATPTLLLVLMPTPRQSP